jgi:hypothetical protein
MHNGEWQSEPVPRIENGPMARADFVFGLQGWDETELGSDDQAAGIRDHRNAQLPTFDLPQRGNPHA